ncbi:lysophospholipase [Aquibacillus sp. 3ASR75-11]|uniref:Lysophospholipase n=1 Tax=Terrihalobacillus insolitus TaxID=2950438 RepID=A0A9X4AKE7_9BACI|nr:alpha/beta hydrolase [Terrihalobacillus insolitus]MDC3412296.1 lysophospholipase [Terrihalobacillus insolitus]MDC3423011.1 lysophospholipase [Terrihalobacillus insolitus]
MDTTDHWLEAKDQHQIRVKKWTKQETNPRAIVQISHGMVEHINRYEPFATFLVQHDVFVYGNDHRGHGETGRKNGVMGHLADENGFDLATDDLHRVTTLIKNDFPNTPIFLFGHSMGSFLARRYIQQFSQDIDGIILSGTGHHPGIMNKFARLLAKREMKRANKLGPSMFLNKLTFHSYNKRIDNHQTHFDWLTRDEKHVQDYINDPETGFVPTATFFYDLFIGFDKIYDISRVKKIRKDLPFLFISGEEDPVGNYGKGVREVIKAYKNQGILDIEAQLYEGGRHEMLNEINKEAVYEDIWNWIVNKIE